MLSMTHGDLSPSNGKAPPAIYAEGVCAFNNLSLTTLGTSHPTVAKQRQGMEERGQLCESHSSIGAGVKV